MTKPQLVKAAWAAYEKGASLDAPGGLTLDPATIIHDDLRERKAQLDTWRATLDNTTLKHATRLAAKRKLERYYRDREAFYR